MTYAPALYITLGARYERAAPRRAVSIMQELIALLVAETDRAEAKRLFERGRQDAR